MHSVMLAFHLEEKQWYLTFLLYFTIFNHFPIVDQCMKFLYFCQLYYGVLWPPGSPRSDLYGCVCETTSNSSMRTFIMQTATTLKTQQNIWNMNKYELKYPGLEYVTYVCLWEKVQLINDLWKIKDRKMYFFMRILWQIGCVLFLISYILKYCIVT